MALNNAGYDMKATLKKEVEIPWNKDRAKEFLWRPIQQIMVDKDSTRKLTTKETIEIYEVLSRHIADKFGIDVAWPHREDL